MGKTSIEAKERYNRKAYEDIRLRVKCGQKLLIQTHAEQQGESLNGYITEAIAQRMTREESNKP